jgi:N-acetylglucosamine-6-sulfatase
MNQSPILVLTLLLAPITARADAEAPTPRPNIIFIMSDDHAAQAIGAYGGRLAKLNPTPTIDRLAKEGMLFENCFAGNSICTPSRATILTGQYNHINKVYDLDGRLDPAHQFLPIELKKAGYQTAVIGKWHLKSEPAAFDHYCVLSEQGEYFDPTFIVRGEKPWPQNSFKRDGEHVTDAITDLAIQWLRGQRDPSKPFFLMYHHKAPHDMFEYAPRYKDYLENVAIPEPESLWNQPQFGSIGTRGVKDELWPYIGTSIGERNAHRNYVKTFNHTGLPTPEQRKRAAYQDYMKRYLRCVKGIDDSLATFFDYLRSAGFMENTLIVYTSDQGMMLGEHDYQDKRWMYEESARMPLIIRYPKMIKHGMRTDAIIENADFAPTLLDFAGVKRPDVMQGRSVKAICETGREPADWRKSAYYRYWMHMAHHDNPAHLGLRTKDYKLIYYYGVPREGNSPHTPPAWELYDLKKDPHELVNVYDDPAYARVVVELKYGLAERRRQIGDDGRDYPAVEAVVQEFWNYDAAARAKAEQISHECLARYKAQSVSSSRQKTEQKPGRE